MKTKTLRIILIGWCLFIGLGAVAGATEMFIDPSGEATLMAGLLPFLRKLPFADILFQNLIFSGISLLIVNGLTQLVSAVLLLKRHPAGSTAGMACGILLMLWICIQFVIMPFNVLSTSYFIFGLLEAVTGYALRRKEKAE